MFFFQVLYGIVMLVSGKGTESLEKFTSQHRLAFPSSVIAVGKAQMVGGLVGASHTHDGSMGRTVGIFTDP